MKNKGLKVLSTSLLLSALFLTGCSCSNSGKTITNIKNPDGPILNGLTNDASKITLEDLYNSLIANDAGNKLGADKVVSIIASDVLKINEAPNKDKYENSMKEKLDELKKKEEYNPNGKFDEKLLVASLKAEGYNIPFDETKQEYDYSFYLKSKYEVEILSNLLKEKYVKEEALKNKKSIIDKKKLREVQYISISSSVDDEYDPYEVVKKVEGKEDETEEVEINAAMYMQTVKEKIIADSEKADANIDADNYFDHFVDDFKLELKKSIETEYKKIDTSEDYNGSIFTEYTNGGLHSPEEGKRLKDKAIDDLEYNFNKIISTDSEEGAAISSTITKRILNISKKDLDETNKGPLKAVKIGQWHYLISAFAGAHPTTDDILLTENDESNHRYSIIRFKVFDKDNYEKAENIDKVIEHLAKTSTLGQNAVSFYIKENKSKIEVVDSSTYKYLKSLYPDVFTD